MGAFPVPVARSGEVALPRDHMRHPSALEGLARMLEGSGNYRVLRRLVVPTTPLPEQPAHRIALIVDVETTGLDAAADEVIQLAAVPISYTPTGEIVAVHEPLNELRDPGRPIPRQVTSLTGIDDAMVSGRVIDEAAVHRLLAVTSVVLAHNAAFDRRFLERLIPVFRDIPWACSLSDIAWLDEGVGAAKLELLAYAAGIYYDAHDALADCLAAIEILRRPLPRSGRIAMAAMLECARRETFRVTAVKAPFDTRSMLKARGYRWRAQPGQDAMAWSIDVSADAVDAEVAFLRESIYRMRIDPPISRITARNRYSDRA